jgi:predicted nuclease of predicted toxin-antitoxin system
MKFLTDVNASGALAQWLIDQGHDVSQVADRDASLPDDEILRWAVEEQRVIISDQDCKEKQRTGYLALRLFSSGR